MEESESDTPRVAAALDRGCPPPPHTAENSQMVLFVRVVPRSKIARERRILRGLCQQANPAVLAVQVLSRAQGGGYPTQRTPD